MYATYLLSLLWIVLSPWVRPLSEYVRSSKLSGFPQFFASEAACLAAVSCSLRLAQAKTFELEGVQI